MNSSSVVVRAALLCAVLVLGASRASAQSPSIDAIWNDPSFKKQFIAGYGINPDIEPRLAKEEVAVLEKVLPLMADELPKAEELLRKSLKQNSSAILDHTLGGILFQQQRYEEALAMHEKAVEKFPNFRRSWRNIGLICVRLERSDGAIRAFTKMIELGGADAYAYGLLGFAYASKQDYQPAEAAYRTALLLQPENTEWRLGLTECVVKQEKFEEAGALLDVLIARYPDNSNFWLQQAKTFLGRKQPLRAAENLEIVAKLGKASPEILNALGDIYLNESLSELAAAAYRRGFDADPQQPLARALDAAEKLATRGAHAQARAMTAAIRGAREKDLEPAERKKLLKLEALLASAEGGSDEQSVRILEELLQLDPLDGYTLMRLGQHYGKSGQPDKAIFYYERAESLDSYEAEAKLRHAQLFAQQSRYGEALPLLRRVQELKPREDLVRYIEQVERAAKAQR